MPKPRLEIASIGGSDKYHAKQFAGIFNSQEWADHAKAEEFAAMPAEAHIARVWDEDRGLAEALAAEFGIERVCDTLDEALDGADGALLVDDVVPSQHRWAPALIESGVPFFLDKPMAPTYAEAKGIVDQAREKNALMFSSSAVRFSRELAEVMPTIHDEGGVRFALAGGPNGRLVFYGIHPAELLLTAMGPGIVEAVNHGGDLANEVRLRWSDDREAVLVVDTRVRAISAFLYTLKRVYAVEVKDSRYYYYHLMRAFVKMVLDREIPVPWTETLELIRVLDRAQTAWTGRGDAEEAEWRRPLA